MYITTDEVVEQLTEKAVAQFTDDVSGQAVNYELLTEIIVNSSGLIDNYLRGRYRLPLNNEHYILKAICLELVKYELYKRRGKIPDAVKEAYTEAVERLKAIQKRDIVLDEGEVITIVYNKENSVYTNEL